MQSNHGHDGSKNADTENKDQPDLLSLGALDSHECLDGQGEDPDVGADIEARCDFRRH